MLGTSPPVGWKYPTPAAVLAAAPPPPPAAAVAAVSG